MCVGMDVVKITLNRPFKQDGKKIFMPRNSDFTLHEIGGYHLFEARK